MLLLALPMCCKTFALNVLTYTPGMHQRARRSDVQGQGGPCQLRDRLQGQVPRRTRPVVFLMYSYPMIIYDTNLSL